MEKFVGKPNTGIPKLSSRKTKSFRIISPQIRRCFQLLTARPYSRAAAASPTAALDATGSVARLRFAAHGRREERGFALAPPFGVGSWAAPPCAVVGRFAGLRSNWPSFTVDHRSNILGINVGLLPAQSGPRFVRPFCSHGSNALFD